MDRAELDNCELDYQIARTPEQKAAWLEKYAERLLREMRKWIDGENGPDMFEFM